MVNDILVREWKQVRGRVKQKWGALTEKEIERIGGKHEALMSVLQEKYGYSRLEAQAEMDDLLLNLARGR